MAQPSQNRDEPSMEDILSSIRKIIQSNDEQQPGDEVVEEADVSEAEIAEEIVSDETTVALEADNVSVDAEASDDANVGTAEVVEADVVSSENGDLTSAPARVDAQSPVTTPPVPTPPQAEAQTVEAEVSTNEDVQPYSSGSNALVSADTSSRIAASFADLTDALSSHSGTNVEDLTTELLKPMLTEWLDDNLPSIVERMVREEIERVARGG